MSQTQILFVIVVFGACLRLLQYVADPALSLDEIAVARNIQERDIWTLLTEPLAFDQAAPKGFVLAEKLATNVFGFSDYSLRLFPLICSLLALLGFWRLAPQVLPGTGPAIALALFATAVPFVAFTSQVKQYSGDVAVSVILMLLAFKTARSDVSRRSAIGSGLAGALAIWFSQPAVFVLAGSIVALFFLTRNNPGEERPRAALTLLLVLWAGAAVTGIVLAFANISPATHEYMQRYWAPQLMPQPITRALWLLWPWNQLAALFGTEAGASLGYPAPALYIVLMIVGFGRLWHTHRRAALLVLAPVAATLCAAVFRHYPFSDRLILFLVPSFILAIAASIEWVRGWTARYSGALMAVLIFCLMTPTIYGISETPPVYQIENIKPVLSYLESRRRPGDTLYVYYGAGPAVNFYGANYGLQPDDYVLGGCHRGYSRLYLKELDRFRGRRRVWIIITHAIPAYRERDDILRYLDVIGSRQHGLTIESQKIGEPGLPAEIFLYDLSDGRALKNAAADNFKLVGPTTVNPRFTCDAGPQAMAVRPSGEQPPRSP